MLIAAGSEPVLGVIVIHCVPTGRIVVLYAAVLPVDFTETVCAAGNGAPVCQTNDNDAGVGVSVAWPKTGPASNSKNEKKRKRTLFSSTGTQKVRSREILKVFPRSSPA